MPDKITGAENVSSTRDESATQNVGTQRTNSFSEMSWTSEEFPFPDEQRELTVKEARKLVAAQLSASGNCS